MNDSFDILNFSKFDDLTFVNDFCNGDVQCVYKNVCEGLTSDFLKKGIWLIVLVFIINWALYWFVMNKTKLFKNKFFSYDFSDKTDRIMFAYEVKNYVIATLCGYIAIWIYMAW